VIRALYSAPVGGRRVGLESTLLHLFADAFQFILGVYLILSKNIFKIETLMGLNFFSHD
jgi:hypothetical protein